MIKNKEVKVCDICGEHVNVVVGPITAIVNDITCTLHLDLCEKCVARIKKEYANVPVPLKYDPFTETYSFLADVNKEETAKKIIEAIPKELREKQFTMETEENKDEEPATGDVKIVAAVINDLVPVDEDKIKASIEIVKFAKHIKDTYGFDLEVTAGTAQPVKDWESASIVELLEAIQEEDFESQAGYLRAFIPWTVLYARLSTKQKQMDLPVGTEFEFNGKKARVVEFSKEAHGFCVAKDCVDCKTLQKFKALPHCSAKHRADGKPVMFMPAGE